jgi:adenine-specific DNA-methyltransferase
MHKTPYGPNRPHPLSQLKTELVWEGKYDEYGKRHEVDIASTPNTVPIWIPNSCF